MNARILVFGSINTDLVVYVERLPMPGETVTGGRFASFPGGKGANQAVAAARAGGKVELFGCLGNDRFGHERLESLQKTGVSTRGIRFLAGTHSGVAQIAVDARGENTIAVAPGANFLFDTPPIESTTAAPGERCIWLFQNEIPRKTTEELIARARAAGHVVIWNLAPTIGRKPEREILAAVSYLICNRNELSALVTEDAGSVEELARKPLSWGVENMIVTLGKDGSLCVSAAGVERQPAFPVDAMDTVGAGDCFCGVFAAALAEGMHVKDALRRASAGAAISCTRPGAQDSMPSRQEIERFLSSRI